MEDIDNADMVDGTGRDSAMVGPVMTCACFLLGCLDCNPDGKPLRKFLRATVRVADLELPGKFCRVAPGQGVVVGRSGSGRLGAACPTDHGHGPARASTRSRSRNSRAGWQVVPAPPL